MAVIVEGEDDGWDPSWEEEDQAARGGAGASAHGEAEPVTQPKSWEDFWSGACKANEQAMRDAAKAGTAPPEQKSLVDGLPADGNLSCAGYAQLFHVLGMYERV